VWRYPALRHPVVVDVAEEALEEDVAETVEVVATAVEEAHTEGDVEVVAAATEETHTVGDVEVAVAAMVEETHTEEAVEVVVTADIEETHTVVEEVCDESSFTSVYLLSKRLPHPFFYDQVSVKLRYGALCL